VALLPAVARAEKPATPRLDWPRTAVAAVLVESLIPITPKPPPFPLTPRTPADPEPVAEPSIPTAPTPPLLEKPYRPAVFDPPPTPNTPAVVVVALAGADGPGKDAKLAAAEVKPITPEPLPLDVVPCTPRAKPVSEVLVRVIAGVVPVAPESVPPAASLLTAIAAEALMSASTIEPSTMFVEFAVTAAGSSPAVIEKEFDKRVSPLPAV